MGSEGGWRIGAAGNCTSGGAHSDYNGETTTANNLVLKAEEQNDVSELEW